MRWMSVVANVTDTMAVYSMAPSKRTDLKTSCPNDSVGHQEGGDLTTVHRKPRHLVYLALD